MRGRCHVTMLLLALLGSWAVAGDSAPSIRFEAQPDRLNPLPGLDKTVGLRVSQVKTGEDGSLVLSITEAVGPDANARRRSLLPITALTVGKSTTFDWRRHRYRLTLKAIGAGPVVTFVLRIIRRDARRDPPQAA